MSPPTPLEISHKKNTSVLGFARVWEDQWIIALVTQHLASSLSLTSSLEISDNYWNDSSLHLPLNIPFIWKHILTNEEIVMTTKIREIALKEIFQKWPIAVLKGNSFQRKF